MANRRPPSITVGTWLELGGLGSETSDLLGGSVELGRGWEGLVVVGIPTL